MVDQWEHARALFWLDLVAGAAAYVLMFYRRRWPLPVALVTSALTLVSGLAAGPATLASISLATRLELRKVVLVGVVGIIAAQGYADWQTDDSEPVWLTFGFNVAITIGMMGWGMYIGSRRQLLWTLRRGPSRPRPSRRRGSPRPHQRAVPDRPGDARRPGPPDLADLGPGRRARVPRGPRPRRDA